MQTGQRRKTKMTNSKLRIVLDDSATEIMNKMMQFLNSEEIPLKVTCSKLTSVIIEHFYNNSFDKEKEQLTKSFIDRNAYLKEIIKNNEKSDDLLEKLELAIQKVKAAPKVRRKKQQRGKRQVVNNDRASV